MGLYLVVIVILVDFHKIFLSLRQIRLSLPSSKNRLIEEFWTVLVNKVVFYSISYDV